MWNVLRLLLGWFVDVLFVFIMLYIVILYWIMCYVGYMKFFNFFDYFVLFFLVGKVLKVFDFFFFLEYKFCNDIDVWNWVLYDIEKMDGFSVGL